MTLLAGLHDREGAFLVPAGGWCVDTVALAESPVAPDYGALALGVNWIVRLNWGYGSTGTLPPGGNFAAFAKRCADYVGASRGCTRWVIGNEPNLPREWPNGQPITPQLYAEFYRACREAIHTISGHAHDEVLIAAPGPWNAEQKYPTNPNGNWITYYRQVLANLGGNFDGVALHSYTHGYDPALVKSNAGMAPPFESLYYEWATYLNYLEVTPRHAAVYITEANGDGPWQATGLIPAMLSDVAEANRTFAGTAVPQIRAVIFYRYPDYDQYGMASKPDVLREFATAAPHYPGPDVTAQAAPSHIVNIPSIPNAQPAPKRIWDMRLTQRGASVQTPAATGAMWRVIMGRWMPEDEAGGRHHIYVDVLDEYGKRVVGVPLLVNWPGGSARIFTEEKRDEPYSANFPMTASRNEFSIRVDDGSPSELVVGLGMGAMTPGGWNAGIHTSTVLHFQRVAQAARQPDPVPPTPPEPAPVDDTQVPVPPSGDMPEAERWARSRAFVRQWEGGFQDHDWDIGNWTGCEVGKGEKKGTNFGISACSYPHLDIRNLTLAQADDIYYRDYWQRSGADQLPWPLCLVVYDTAVNFHPSTAQKWLAESGGDLLHFVALRLRGYRKSKAWPQAGNAWVDRVIDLALEAVGR